MQVCDDVVFTSVPLLQLRDCKTHRVVGKFRYIAAARARTHAQPRRLRRSVKKVMLSNQDAENDGWDRPCPHPLCRALSQFLHRIAPAGSDSSAEKASPPGITTLPATRQARAHWEIGAKIRWCRCPLIAAWQC